MHHLARTAGGLWHPSVPPIVTIREIIQYLHNQPVEGKVYIDDEMRGRMEDYLDRYGRRVERLWTSVRRVLFTQATGAGLRKSFWIMG